MTTQTRDMNADAKIGQSRGMSNHSHDLVQELSVRLDSQWRYDQYIQNARDANMPEAVQIFERLKRETQQAIEDLRGHIEQMCRDGKFH